MVDAEFDQNVFVNCPFDPDYKPIMEAVLFCLVRFGFKPRIATEKSDSAEPRIKKIYELIQASKYSVHDLSRCQASEADELFRLNMPFELGLDFGCRKYGGHPYSEKIILILEEERYRLQKVISDLAGSDIEAHEGNYQNAMRMVRNWLTTNISDVPELPASSAISDYEDFQKWYIERQRTKRYSKEEIQNIPTPELLKAMLHWIDSDKPRVNSIE